MDDGRSAQSAFPLAPQPIDLSPRPLGQLFARHLAPRKLHRAIRSANRCELGAEPDLIRPQHLDAPSLQGQRSTSRGDSSTGATILGFGV